jgi:hypothetical protein
MHFAYLSLIPEFDFVDSESYIKSSPLSQKLSENLRAEHVDTISVVQRSLFKKKSSVNDVDYYFITDEFDPILRWWQEPEQAFQLLFEINPEVIVIRSLDLPLQFRWLRRIIGENVIIIGEHTGEEIWASRNLWLQQFGLRVADGFLFNNLKKSHPWTKASVILEKQPIIEIDLNSNDPQKTAQSVVNFYNNLLTTKNTEVTNK